MLTIAAAGLLLLAAPGHDSGDTAEAEIIEVVAVGTDYAWEGIPDEIGAGLVTFTIENQGEDIHHAQLVRLRPGGDFDAAFAALLGEDFETVFENVELVGGPGIVAPGASASATVTLAPGEYLIGCFLPAPDGRTHAEHGMLHEFTVTGEAVEVPALDVVGEIMMHDFDFEFPDDLDGRVSVSNNGEQPHEMLMFQIPEGVTFEESLAFLAAEEPVEGPPLAIPVGGLQVIMPGATGYIDLSELAPGTYGVVCFVPDPETGKSHLELGMRAQFTVP